MASRLGAVQSPIQPRSFLSTPGVDFFLDKIQWIYGLCVVTVASFCIYNLVRGTELLRNSSIQLSSAFNPLRCQILLAEIEEKLKKNPSADIRSSLEKCQALSRLYDKEQKCLPKLIVHYSKIDSNHACMLAQHLSSAHDILHAAQALKDSASPPSPEKIVALYDQGLRIHRIDCAKSRASLDVYLALEYAQAFHSLGNDVLKNEAFSLAWNCVDRCPNMDMKLHMVCSIARTYEKIKDAEQVKKTLEKALEISNTVSSPHGAISGLFAVANLFFDLKDYDKMLGVVNPLLKIHKENQSVTYIIKKLKLAAKNCAEPSAPTLLELKDFSAETILNQLFQDLQSTPSKNIEQTVRDYQQLASAYFEFSLHTMANEALACALSTIGTLDIATEEEMKKKLEFLQYFVIYDSFATLSADMVQKLVQQLQLLYDATATKELYLKNSIGIALLKFCNRKNLTETSDKVFKRYLADNLTQNGDAAGKINGLTTDALSGDGLFDSGLSSEQYRAILEAAEKLLPQVPPLFQTSMALRISQGYLKISWQKSLEFLKEYDKKIAVSQAKKHLTVGAISAIVAGVMYASPQMSGPLLTLSAGLYSLYRN